VSVHTDLFPLRDYCAWFAIFRSPSGDQYKAELVAEEEMDARREARAAFGQSLLALHLEHIATGHIVLEVDWTENAET
jgi:hypothetical protein